MQRVREFLIVKNPARFGNRLPSTTMPEAVGCEGWHQSWDTAVQLAGVDNNVEREFEVAIADKCGGQQVIAIFSSRNLESTEPIAGETKWKSVRVSASDGRWCNLNCSDYGWEWVSGAEREVPFRLRYIERQAVLNPDGLISRTRALFLEARDWFYGHGKKIG